MKKRIIETILSLAVSVTVFTGVPAMTFAAENVSAEQAVDSTETDEKENKSENIMKYIDKNRTDGGRVRIYTFSCF